jgi:branched-chain amino acid transport system substrate-binding protein
MRLKNSLIVAVAAALCVTANAQTLKIGVQLPLTGERADVGKLMHDALQMAVEKANSQNGAKGPKLELVWADDESTTEGATKALDKIAHDPSIIAIAGEINSPLVLASAPVVDKEGVPYLTGGSSPRTTAQSPWIFRVGASDAFLADSIASYVAGDLKLKSVAILHDKTGVHNQRATLVTGVLKDKYQITAAVNADWSPGDKDFAAQLQQVKAANAQALIALGETAEGGPFLKQVRSSGVTAQVVAHRDFGVKKVFDDAGAAADGTLIVTEYAPALQSAATQAWAAAYKTKNGADANVIAAQYYDALLLLAEAIKTGGPTRAGVKTGLEHIKAFPGVMADYTFDAGRNGVHRFFVAKVAGGKLTQVKTLTE